MQQSYSTAPYSQALPSPAHQQFAQHRQTASPSSTTPYGTPHMQHPPHQHSPSALPSNGQHPPPTPMSQSKPETPQAQTPVKAVPASPVSPVAHARSQDRVATLLEINSLLIKEVCELQAQGKAGQVGETKPEGDKPQPSKEYVEYVASCSSPSPSPRADSPQLHAPSAGQPRVPGAERREEPQARPGAPTGPSHHVGPRRPDRARQTVPEAVRSVPWLEGPDAADEAVPRPPAHELDHLHWLAAPQQRGSAAKLEPKRHG
jgi:hypothetical protein